MLPVSGSASGITCLKSGEQLPGTQPGYIARPNFAHISEMLAGQAGLIATE
jgi:hypothetical protein